MRRSRGISSIYGFIMIFLLSMASIQVWSTAVGSLSQIQSASQQSHELQQMQGLERLSLSESQGNLTITNDGQVPSTIEFLRWVGENDSETVSVNQLLAVGGSLQRPLKSGYTPEAITSLGNVFLLASTGSSSNGPGLLIQGSGGLAQSNAQLFQSQYDPSVFFVVSGSSVYAFSTQGSTLWSFDAGQGFVTDVLPLANGDVYVSVGYLPSASDSTELFELGSSGTVLSTFPVREDEQVDGSYTPQVPVTKGQNSQYILYDGEFYFGGQIVSSLPSDSFGLAATDSSNFYFYQTLGGSCPNGGSEIRLYSYTPDNTSPTPHINWTDYFYPSTCDSFAPGLLSATAGGGLIALLFTQPAYTAGDGTQSSGANPYLIITTTAGSVFDSFSLPSSGYSTSMATNGTTIYLVVPALDEVQSFDSYWLTPKTYEVGIPASQLLWAYNSLFVISNNEVKVYDGGMVLEKSISFSPLQLASFSNSFSSETQLHTASFLPINSTSYAALVENATGSVSLVFGRYI